MLVRCLYVLFLVIFFFLRLGFLGSPFVPVPVSQLLGDLETHNVDVLCKTTYLFDEKESEGVGGIEMFRPSFFPVWLKTFRRNTCMIDRLVRIY